MVAVPAASMPPEKLNEFAPATETILPPQVVTELSGFPMTKVAGNVDGATVKLSVNAKLL